MTGSTNISNGQTKHHFIFATATLHCFLAAFFTSFCRQEWYQPREFLNSKTHMLMCIKVVATYTFNSTNQLIPKTVIYKAPCFNYLKLCPEASFL